MCNSVVFTGTEVKGAAPQNPRKRQNSSLLSAVLMHRCRFGLKAVCQLLTAFAVVALLGGATVASAAPTVAKDARLGGDLRRTRFVADLSREVRFRLFTLADPYRVIVDLPDVQFQFPTGLGKKGRGLISSYRYGLIASGRARIVIEVVAPVIVDKAFVLSAKNGQPARLVIDLARTDRKTFLASKQSIGNKTTKIAPRWRKKSALPAVKKKKKKAGRPVVIIDPGHGGIDPGATSRSGLKEKNVVFAFSRALRQRLNATGRYKVILTRTIDAYIPLRERVATARRHDGDLFISIHADSVPGRYSQSISGATVYTLSEKASDAETKALAAKENRSDVIAGVDLPDTEDEVTGILIDLAMRETKNLSINFADIILANLKGKTPLMKKAHRFAGFRVLKAPDIPSVLVELGYMSNPGDVKKLTSKAWRDKVAGALVHSVDRFFAAKKHGFRFNEAGKR